MNKGYFITDEQMKAAIYYLLELDRGIDDKTLTKEQNTRNYERWIGARRILRRLSITGSDIAEIETSILA